MISRAKIAAAGLAALCVTGAGLSQDEIEVQSLDALDPFEVGLPDAWMGSTLWDGSDAAMVHAVLDRLPNSDSGSYASTAVAELARAVLSTGGYPPRGARGDGVLAAKRMDRLLAAAGPNDTFDLLERTPNINQSSGLAQLHAELGFALYREHRSCATANALLNGRELAYWVRVRAFCLALDNQNAAAELSAELARSIEPDPGFDALLYALTLDSELEGALPDLDSGLKLAMARRVRTVDGDRPEPAETAPNWLRSLADENTVAFDASHDPVESLVHAETQTGALRTQMLEAVLAQGGDREAAASALHQLLNDARQAGDFTSAARRYGRDIDTLPITRHTLDGGDAFALAALMVGDLRTARRWRDALIDGPPRRAAPVQDMPDKPGVSAPVPPPFVDEEPWPQLPPRQLITLDLAIAVAGDRLRGGQTDALLAAYLEGRGAAGLPELLALTRLGAAAPDGMRALLLETESATGGVLAALDAAVSANATAEAALLAVAALSATPDQQTADAAGSDTGVSADVLGRTVAALDAIEMRDAALYIILEQIIQRAG